MWVPYVNWQGAQTLCFAVANFRDDYKQFDLFTKLEKEQLPLSNTGGSRRRQ